MVKEGFWFFRILEWNNKKLNVVMDVIIITTRNENKYHLLLSNAENIPQPSIVGEFRHEDDKGFRFFIVLNDKQVEQTNHREMCITWGQDDNGKECAIAYITKDMLLKLQGRKHHISSLWHELGHIHYEDYNCAKINQPADISKTRKAYIQQGKVMDIELRADEFACRQFGIKNMLKFLDSAAQERKQSGDNNSQLAIKEIEMRITHLKTYGVGT